MTSDPTSTTDDTLLAGKVKFRQPASGYRAAIDPVLLAAAVPESVQGRVLDLGCGAGAALLCLARRREDLTVVGLERDPAMADLARHNATANGFGTRVSIVTGDLLNPPPQLMVGSFDAVMANPPHLETENATPSPVPGKAAATHESEARMADWARAAARFVRGQGIVLFVHRMDRLGELRAAVEQAGCGSLVMCPLYPKVGTDPKRVILLARRGAKPGVQSASGLILHEHDDRFTAKASAILRDGVPFTVV